MGVRLDHAREYVFAADVDLTCGIGPGAWSEQCGDALALNRDIGRVDAVNRVDDRAIAQDQVKHCAFSNFVPPVPSS